MKGGLFWEDDPTQVTTQIRGAGKVREALYSFCTVVTSELLILVVQEEFHLNCKPSLVI